MQTCRHTVRQTCLTLMDTPGVQNVELGACRPDEHQIIFLPRLGKYPPASHFRERPDRTQLSPTGLAIYWRVHSVLQYVAICCNMLQISYQSVDVVINDELLDYRTKLD